MAASEPGQTYQDSAGWTITVPPGWQVAPFSDMQDGMITAGVQLSNVPLPPPAVIPGYAVQVLDHALPAHGIGLTIIADTDTGPSGGTVSVPPLSYPDGWWTGSSLSGNPYMRGLSFRVGGRSFAAAVKIGPQVTGADHAGLVAAVRSIR